MKTDIRFAKPEDVEACVAVDKSLGFELKLDYLKLAQEQRQLVVATDGEKAVAYLWFCYLWGHKPFINFMHVIPEHQGQGAGRQMVEFFEGEMKKLGKEFIFSSSDESNEGGRVFHKKLGFEECGDWALKDKWKEVFFLKRI